MALSLEYINSIKFDLRVFMLSRLNIDPSEIVFGEINDFNHINELDSLNRHVFICAEGISAGGDGNYLVKNILNNEIKLITSSYALIKHIMGDEVEIYKIIDSTYHKYATHHFYISDEFIEMYMKTHGILKYAKVSSESSYVNNSGFKHHYSIPTIEWLMPWQKTLLHDMQYGMKIAAPISPLNIIGPLAFTSSNDPKIFSILETTKYWDNDEDICAYKVNLSIGDYKEHSYYTSDLRSLCESGTYIVYDKYIQELEKIYDLLYKKCFITSAFVKEFNKHYDITHSDKSLVKIFTVVSYIKNLIKPLQ